MKKHSNILTLLTISLALLMLATSCKVEDPGPLQAARKDFSIVDFDQLEMGDAFHIEVNQSEFFSVSINGDRRNIDDLRVRKQGTTLVIDFSDGHNREHETFITISMPVLRSVNFSGASDSHIAGFSDHSKMNFILSGASTAQLNSDPSLLHLNLSGASHLKITGTADNLEADISGASGLSAFDFIVEEADVNASGASEAKVSTTSGLHAVVSGASRVLYRGQGKVTSEVSGASSVQKD